MRASLPCLAATALLAIAVIVPTCARAADVSLVAGRSMTTEQRWTTSAFISIGADQTWDFKGLHFQPVVTAGWIKARREQRERLDHNVYIVGGGMRLVNWWHGAFASFQFGLTDGRTDALSSPEQFISSLGWQGKHWMVMVRHISNGNVFPGKNLGETMLLAGVRF